MNQTTPKKAKKSLIEKAKQGLAISCLIAGTSGIGLAVTSMPTHATAVDDLKTEVDKVDGIFDVIQDPVVASMAFAAGAMLIKRIVYA
jgi:hypothetical protein